MTKKKDQLGFGLIGCGDIGIINSRAVAEAELSRLVVCADLDKSLAKSLGTRYDIPYVKNAIEVFESKDVDVVFLCTPPFTHAPLASEAFANGKHVITEKPMSNNLASANEMIAASRKARKKLSICFAERYQPYVRESKILIDNGILGNIFGTQLLFHHDMIENYWTRGFSGASLSNWRGSKIQSGGGILAANLVHFLDVIRYLTGLEVVQSHSSYDTFDTPVEVEDSLVATYRYDNGALGSINGFNCVRGTEYLFDFRIWGTNGHISLSKPLRFYSLKNISGYKPGRWHEIKTEVGNARADFVQDFCRALLNDQDVPVSGEDGKVIQTLVESFYSAKHR